MTPSFPWLGRFVAEVKTKSPFGYHSGKAWEDLFELADGVGDALSIHVSPRFGGSREHLAQARRLTRKPILAKGFHPTDDDIRRSLDLGADAVLVVGRIPPENLIPKCWLEPRNLAELLRLPKSLLCMAVWNERNLASGRPKTTSWHTARKMWPGLMCQASMIASPKDIHPGACCFIVGENLAKFASKYER